VVFALVWLGNLSTALLMYALGRSHGSRFFQGPLGSRLLRPRQMEKLGEFYARRGTVVIFVSRFLPMFRAVVPVFAGTSGVSFWRAALPMALASALWYGGIVYLGATAGANWQEIRGMVESSGRWLGVAALLLALAVGAWWWRSRHEEPAAGA
jgi:membrane protein DedA with SNARE-associated domain